MNKHQLEKVAVKWLNQHYGNLMLKVTEDYPESFFYVNSNNEVMMEYDEKNARIWVHYGQIWSKIESLFHLEYREAQSIIKAWLETPSKMKDATPLKRSVFFRALLETPSKMKDDTPGTTSRFALTPLETPPKMKDATPEMEYVFQMVQLENTIHI